MSKRMVPPTSLDTHWVLYHFLKMVLFPVFYQDLRQVFPYFWLDFSAFCN